MFREMRRFKQQVSQDECKKILKDEKRAAFSVIGDEGYPYTIPINFYYEEADHTIYFHGAREGHKMDAIQKCNKVCLTTWNQGFKKEGHWEWNATSVVVFGKAELITDTKIIEDRLRKLAEKYYPTVEEVEKEMNINEIFNIQKNESGDIQLIEYNSINVTKILGKITNSIQNYLIKIEEGNIDLTDDKLLNIDKNKLKRGIIYEIPIGVYSNSIFLSNLGPKIPVKMQLIGDIASSISTNVKEYGINNALIEVGVTIEVKSRVILPYISNDIKIKGTIPIALKVIQGKIPSYYLSGFKSDSNIITSSIVPPHN